MVSYLQYVFVWVNGDWHTMSIGERIRKSRNACGITQAQLADEIGCSEPAIRLYELGKRTPKPEILEKIAKSLNVRPQSLSEVSINSARDALELLFRMEDECGLVPGEDGSLSIDRKAKNAPKLDKAIRQWAKARKDLNYGKISVEEYESWRAKYK